MNEHELESNNVQQLPEGADANMSKTQLKKLKKRMKLLENKRERRLAEKQKKKKRLAERRERGEDVGPSRKNLKLNTMMNSSCKIKVVLDLSLEGYMSDKDISSLTLQIQHSYSSNRRAANPMQLYACGLGGRTQQRLDSIGDYKSWDIHFKEESYIDVFPKESIVYLSSESSNVLTSLSEDKVYIIGGLVDHNSHKGLCHRLAEEKGIDHAQLPISEFLHLKGRKVLAINHVFSILLRFTESGDWKQAFVSELPKRKGFYTVCGEGDQQNSDTKKEGEVGATSDPDDDDDDEPEREPSCDNSLDATESTTTTSNVSKDKSDNSNCSNNGKTDCPHLDSSEKESVIEDDKYVKEEGDDREEKDIS